MYWAGLLYADGYISSRRYTPEIQLCQSVEKIEHIVKFKTFLSSEHKLTVVKQNTAYGATEMCRLSFGSEQIAEDLKNLGIHGKKLQRTPSCKAKQSKDFWRGVLEGDGYLCLQGKDGYSRLDLVGSNITCNLFVDHITQHCVDTQVNVLPHKSIYRVQLHGDYVKDIISYFYEKGQPAWKVKH